MTLLLLSFFAGILTVLAPCVLPLLPIIIGGSVGKQDPYRPYFITAGLAVSLAIFTLLLKISQVALNIDPFFWQAVSAGIVIFLGLISLFPAVWDKISLRFKFATNSDKLLNQAEKRNGIVGALLTGAALGPVFSSCSPTYAFALSTALQGNLVEGLTNLLAYIIGLSVIMLLIGIYGQRIIKKLKWAANPNGLFRRGLGVIFILVGVFILTGADKVVQRYYEEKDPFQTIKFEQKILESNRSKPENSTGKKGQFNVIPPTPAPEFAGLDSWINSDPQTIASLKGKVVLVDFWTYSCINCQRTLPYLTKWYDTYKDQGFVIIGVHAPEFAFEKKKENVQKSVDQFKINYPVALDNDFQTWSAYKNQFWPAKYLIDANGQVRYTHFGEGEYAETEGLIRQLLEESGKKVDVSDVSSAIKPMGGSSKMETPETYLGWNRAVNFVNEVKTVYNQTADYKQINSLSNDQWTLNGSWQINNENIISQSDTSVLRLNFRAKNVYLVAGSQSPQMVLVKINGQLKSESNAKLFGPEVNDQSKVLVETDKLYHVVEAQDFQTGSEVEFTVPKGVRLNVFTFGS